MAEHHPLFLPICKTRSTLHTLFPVVEVWQKFVFNPLHIIRIVTINFFLLCNKIHYKINLPSSGSHWRNGKATGNTFGELHPQCSCLRSKNQKTCQTYWQTWHSLQHLAHQSVAVLLQLIH